MSFFCDISLGYRFLKDKCNLKEDYSLTVDLCSKRKREENAKYLPIRFDPKKHIICTSTDNSAYTIDYIEKFAHCVIFRNDSLGSFTLFRVLNDIFLLAKISTIHGVCLEKKNFFIILIGKSGSGKTTLSNFLTKEDKEVKILVYDGIFIVNTGKHICLVNDMLYGKPVSKFFLFFLERNKDKVSMVFPIKRKEAFKRITLYSDVIMKENDPQVDYRLGTLRQLIYQSKSFVIVNGKDLEGNSKSFKKFIDIALKGGN